MKLTGQPHRDALDATSCAIVITDATRFDNPIVYANAAFSAMSGYAHDDVIGHNCRFLQGPASDALVVADIRAAIAAGSAIRRDIVNYRKDGTAFWNDLSIDPVRDAVGTLTGFIAIQRVADATHLAIKDKVDAEARLARIAAHIPGYIYQRVMRPDGTIEVLYLSPSMRKLLGIPDSEISPQCYDYVHPDDRPALIEAVRSSAANMSIFREEFRLVSRDGTVHWLRSDAPPQRLPNGDIQWDGLAIEIAAETRWVSEIANQALRDPLTGLLARTAGRQALIAQLGASTAPCGVVHVNIVDFRGFNERFGQTVGDAVLKETGQRLSRIAAPAGGIAIRLGGDEFAILMPSCADQEALSSFALSIGEAIALPMTIGARQLAIKTCIGAALCSPRDAEGSTAETLADELMTQAELALRWAKQAGCIGPMLYSPEQDDRFRNQAMLARSLEHGIANNELDLHYQPLVDIVTGRIVSAEALVRWHHPTLGMQRPDLFIPLAEQLGLIGHLGCWVLRRAFHQRKEWAAAGLSPPSIAINISGSQLLAPGFVADVRALVETFGADPHNFELELTEGLLTEPSPLVLASLHALRAMGFTITIDDFGSGHATFRYLRDFPVDKLKIDQMFVRKLVLGSTDALIIRAVISLARSMNVAFVAEGIETQMQREFLAREGCEIGQGYLFSLPLVPEDFGWMLANDVRLPLAASTDPIENDDAAELTPAMERALT